MNEITEEELSEIDECLEIFYPNKFSYERFIRLSLKYNKIITDLYKGQEKTCMENKLKIFNRWRI